MTLQLQSLMVQIAELMSSDHEWHQDSHTQINELREPNMVIQCRLDEAMRVTDTHLNHNKDRITALTVMQSDLQRQVNIPGSHFNPPDIAIPAHHTSHLLQLRNASYSREEGTLMPVVSPIASSTGGRESPDGPMSTLPSVAEVSGVSATGVLSPMQSPAADRSLGTLILPTEDVPMSAEQGPVTTPQATIVGCSQNLRN
ncbi:hypothetical protein AZE42_12577 [Rhizopogon vesiculosus]|uniref:Uncharacterized protein n=1 Tax=Rhizopogon vesiculosus TaxID=180088 RepID=A0A1J8Q8G8_9AGAM|nr:hypothetical protein AZE42_12577 [Rhizopogon vesiculosus]